MLSTDIWTWASYPSVRVAFLSVSKLSVQPEGCQELAIWKESAKCLRLIVVQAVVCSLESLDHICIRQHHLLRRARFLPGTRVSPSSCIRLKTMKWRFRRLSTSVIHYLWRYRLVLFLIPTGNFRTCSFHSSSEESLRPRCPSCPLLLIGSVDFFGGIRWPWEL
jgi:hypothetical protein